MRREPRELQVDRLPLADLEGAGVAVGAGGEPRAPHLHHGPRPVTGRRCPVPVTKTSVDVDRDVAAQAAAILGTSTLKDTIHASLLEVVNARRRLELVALLADPGRFDFDVIDDAWGGGR